MLRPGQQQLSRSRPPVPAYQGSPGEEVTRLTAQATPGVIPEVVSLAPIPLELRPRHGAAPFSPLWVQHVDEPGTQTEATDE